MILRLSPQDICGTGSRIAEKPPGDYSLHHPCYSGWVCLYFIRAVGWNSSWPLASGIWRCRSGKSPMQIIKFKRNTHLSLILELTAWDIDYFILLLSTLRIVFIFSPVISIEFPSLSSIYYFNSFSNSSSRFNSIQFSLFYWFVVCIFPIHLVSLSNSQCLEL